MGWTGEVIVKSESDGKNVKEIISCTETGTKEQEVMVG
jgi:hypothetical protein